MEISENKIQLKTVSLKQTEPKSTNHSMVKRGGVVSETSLQKSSEWVEKDVGATIVGFQDAEGLILPNMSVFLIFLGNVWNNNPSPSIQDIVKGINEIITGPYMSQLAQYRGITNAHLDPSHGTSVDFDPQNPFPNPFSDDDLFDVLQNLYMNNNIPNPTSNNQLFYFFIMPQGAIFKDTGNNKTIGEHTFRVDNNLHVNVHFGWTLNRYGTLKDITEISSHELVEACTDPEGTGIIGIQGTCRTNDGWCEIGDVCGGLFKNVNGVSVQKYWSQQNHDCI